MTNQELIALCLKYSGANIDHMSEFLDPKDSDPTEPFDLEAVSNQLFRLAKIVEEDWTALMEIIRLCRSTNNIYYHIAETMDVNNEELSRLINLARMLQEE